MTSPQTSPVAPSPSAQPSASEENIRFADSYQTSVNAGTYTITATLRAPEDLKDADLADPITNSVKVHISGPRYSLSPDEIHAVFPPENGSGDYNNVLPHVVLNRPTLPWERLLEKKINKQEKDKTEAEKKRDNDLEQIPFLALLLFTEAEELAGAVTPPQVVSLAELGYDLEPGEKGTDPVTVIQVNADLLTYLLPTGNELRLLAHGRELFQSSNDQSSNQKTDTSQSVESRRPLAVVIASRLPASDQRHIAHLVMLENRYTWHEGSTDWQFNLAGQPNGPVRLVCLKSWQFTCAGNQPTLEGRLLDEAFTVDWLCVPKTGTDAFEKLRRMGYAALPYHLRSGDRAYTLYHGPLVATPSAQTAAADTSQSLESDPLVPASAESLVRIVENHKIFDVSLAAAWRLGQLLMLRDQAVAMTYFTWRRHDAQRRARANLWQQDGHLHLGDNARIGLEPMPAVVQDWLQQCLALHNIPFNYLVPDGRMVPENSLRVFSLHKPWMACLVAGALAVGRSSDADRRLETDYRKTIFTADQQTWSGFLLRSPAVDEHLDLQVKAIQGEVEIDKIRLERLGPGLLLGIYADSFSELRFSLPPLGLFFGFQENGNNKVFPFSKPLRNPPSTSQPKNPPPTGQLLEVPMKENLAILPRGGAVIDTKALSENIKNKIDNPSPIMTSGLFAYYMCEGTESVIFNISKP